MTTPSPLLCAAVVAVLVCAVGSYFLTRYLGWGTPQRTKIRVDNESNVFLNPPSPKKK